MSLLEKLIENDTINAFLQPYPEKEWPKVISQAVQYAIFSYKGLQRSGFQSSVRKTQPLTSREKGSIPKSQRPSRKSSKKCRRPIKNCSKRKIQKENFKPKTWEDSPTYRRDQSFLRPDINMKRFYQKEFSQLLPPTRLQPVELPLEEDRQNPSQSAELVSFTTDFDNSYM